MTYILVKFVTLDLAMYRIVTQVRRAAVLLIL